MNYYGIWTIDYGLFAHYGAKKLVALLKKEF